MRLILPLALVVLLPACAERSRAQDQPPTQNAAAPTPPLNPAPVPQANVVTPEQPNAPQPQPVPRNEDNSPAETGDDQPPKR